MNLPTWITVSRLFGIPFVLYWLHSPTDVQRWWCFGVFLAIALTDWLDGYLARQLDQVTELGKFLDPLVDKLMILAPMLALIELGQVPAWGVFLILGRELAIAGWRVNPNLAGNAVPGANIWGKLKTVSQIAAVALLIVPGDRLQEIGFVLFWIAVVLTLVSGMLYVKAGGRGQKAKGKEEALRLEESR